MDKQNINKKPSNLLSKDNLDLSTLENARRRSWNDLSTRIDTWDKQQMQPETKLPKLKKFLLPFSVGFATTAIAGVFILTGTLIYQNYSKINSNSTSSKNIQAQLADSLQKNTGLTLDDLKFLQQNGIISATNTSNSGINAVYANAKLDSNIANEYQNLVINIPGALDPSMKAKAEEIVSKLPNQQDTIMKTYKVTVNDLTKYMPGIFRGELDKEMQIDPKFKILFDKYKNYLQTPSTRSIFVNKDSTKITESKNGKLISLNAGITNTNTNKNEVYSYMGGSYAIKTQYDIQPVLQDSIPDGDLYMIMTILINPNVSGYKYIGEQVVNGFNVSVYEMSGENPMPTESPNKTFANRVYIDTKNLIIVRQEDYSDNVLVTQTDLVDYKNLGNQAIDLAELNGIEIKNDNYASRKDDNGNSQITDIDKVPSEFTLFKLKNLTNINGFMFMDSRKILSLWENSGSLANTLFNNSDYDPYYGIQQKIQEIYNRTNPQSTLKTIPGTLGSSMYIAMYQLNLDPTNDGKTLAGEFVNIYNIKNNAQNEIEDAIKETTKLSKDVSQTAEIKNEVKDVEIYLDGNKIKNGKLVRNTYTDKYTNLSSEKLQAMKMHGENTSGSYTLITNSVYLEYQGKIYVIVLSDDSGLGIYNRYFDSNRIDFETLKTDDVVTTSTSNKSI